MFTALSVLVFIASVAPARDDVKDIPSKEVQLRPAPQMKRNAPKRSYFLIGPRKDAEAPENGFKLLIIMPGGDGGSAFHPFVKRIYKHVLGPEWVAAQPIAVKWSKSKSIVWPTYKDAIKGYVLGTERFVEDMITDAARRVKLDPAHIFLLTWSSGGPAAYSHSLQKYKSVTGFYITMSVFKPERLPPLKEARDEAFFIDHSPDDNVCPYHMARKAEQFLKKAGAKVTLKTYQGGHGWHGNIYGRMNEGIQWLEKNKSPMDKRMWPEKRLGKMGKK